MKISFLSTAFSHAIILSFFVDSVGSSSPSASSIETVHVLQFSSSDASCRLDEGFADIFFPVDECTPCYSPTDLPPGIIAFRSCKFIGMEDCQNWALNTFANSDCTGGTQVLASEETAEFCFPPNDSEDVLDHKFVCEMRSDDESAAVYVLQFSSSDATCKTNEPEFLIEPEFPNGACVPCFSPADLPPGLIGFNSCMATGSRDCTTWALNTFANEDCTGATQKLSTSETPTDFCFPPNENESVLDHKFVCELINATPDDDDDDDNDSNDNGNKPEKKGTMTGKKAPKREEKAGAVKQKHKSKKLNRRALYRGAPY
mmetsp:Transcript_28733/g.42441  ORF Transcript_28733/g.42441 Transcript_28733/m.42441 type:complete len:316 (-) Transcript_28733:39-986(-)